jgi:hypothetical protein
MKKLFFVLLSMVIVTFATADPWEDVTQEQAEQIVNHLKLHPYILDYCDCCGSGEVYLMKVLSTEIIQCSYDEEKKTVVAEVLKMGKLEVYDGSPSAYRTEAVEEAEVESFVISMNYTFVYSACGQWAVPFFKEVADERNHICNGATRFPSPFDNEIVLDDPLYIEWFVENIGK